MSIPTLYKYTSCNNAINTIINSSFKWSTIDEFNDPFESRFHFQPTLTNLVRTVSAAASLNRGIFKSLDINSLLENGNIHYNPTVGYILTLREKVDEIVKKYSGNYNESFFYEVEKTVWNVAHESDDFQQLLFKTIDFKKQSYDVMNKCFGILCLTENKSDMLMWSHYGNNHKGVVLGLDFNKLATYPEESYESYIYRSVYKVNYQNKYPEMRFEDILGMDNIIFPKQNKTFFKKISATKQLCWKYENEHRSIISIKNKGKINKMPTECISSITIGCAMSKENQEKILSISEKYLPKIEVYINKLNPESYELIRDRLK